MNEPDTQGNTNPMVMSEDEPAIELAIGTIDAVGDDNINPELESGETNCDKEASIESNEEENCREGMDNPIKNLIGRNIKVHIQNLVEPAKERKTRELDTEHVTALEEQFKKELNLYTVLIGHMPEKLELDQLEIPGRAVVEVLGGNHTRQALMNIGKTNMLVSMDLYMSLSNEQALRLGLKHNDIHRLSRQTTFEESIKLFREVLFRIKKQKPHMKPKDISAEWRLNVASIMDTPKSKINKFQTHLHCASLPDQQTHLFHLFRVHNEVDKIRLLDELACGKITFQEFKDQCLKGKVENMAVSHTIKKTKGQKKKSKAVDNTPLKEDDVLRDNLITEILELKKKIKQDEMATVNMKLRHDNLEKNNRELENKYTAELTQNESMQHQIKNLTDSLSSMEKKNKNLTEELDMAKDIYKTEKKKSDDVERNITHALNETEKKQSDKIYQLQEHIKEKDLKIESLHLQLNMVNDAANRARNEVREIAKKRPHEITEDTEDIRPDTQTKKMKATTDAITVSEETIDISQNEEIAMVEYNNENVYLGVLQDSMLTFTRQPLGKLGPDFVIKDLNFSLNKKDRQLINSAYIIENIKCKIVKNKFTINEEQKKT
ncbi:unnamed protein product [Mytilus edulis]|uniref:Uncharacterized protein n=1 Tax=Mytilus edulis TaxID=6550 RepID=A0A8S3UUS2_MYTED|nr:unnamed protein product [Mytilus edulis]